MTNVFGLVALLGLLGVTVGLVALTKGKLEWAKIRDRKAAGLLTAISFVWLAFASAVTPAESTRDLPERQESRDVPTPVSRTAPLNVENADWHLVDGETIDILGTAEPGARITASWSGGSASGTADATGNFRLPVGPITQIGETRVDLTASSGGKEPARTSTTVTRSLSEAKLKSMAQSIPYDELKKDPDARSGSVVTYKGEVFQYDSRTTTASMIISVTSEGYGFWSDEMHLLLNPALGANVDEKDIIQVWGRVTGSYTYETAMGGSNTVPQVLIEYLTVISKK